MSKLVTIIGGSGFLGRYVARRMAKQGWRVRVAVRRPNEALFVRTYGTVGQVEPVLCNIRDDASVAAAIHGADAVANCVGTFDARGRNNFEAIQHQGAARVARLAAEAGVKHLVHVSAIGADLASDSEYARTKALGEAEVQKYFPRASILRPSVMFGPEDNFFNRFASMSRFGPVLPIVGGNTKFQPVYVDDVARAASRGLTGEVPAGTYELGGPEIKTLRELIDDMLVVIRRRRLVINLPFWMARILAGTLSVAEAVTLGLFHNTILTPDQVRQLRHDNIVSAGALTFADLGIEPTPYEAVLPDYLWVYRPAGQYQEIMESARNLRT